MSSGFADPGFIVHFDPVRPKDAVFKPDDYIATGFDDIRVTLLDHMIGGDADRLFFFGKGVCFWNGLRKPKTCRQGRHPEKQDDSNQQGHLQEIVWPRKS